MATIINLVHRLVRRWSMRLYGALGPRGFAITVTLAIFTLLQIILLSIAASQSSLKTHATCETGHSNARCLLKVRPRIPWAPNLPTIYVVTPTYARPVQKAELVRLAHTLLMVPALHWIIVEDVPEKQFRDDGLVGKFVERLRDIHGLATVTHLYAPTPEQNKLKPGEPHWKRPKGIWQRNRALQWIVEKDPELDENGVIYFADDDNTYDLELFNEMRHTSKVSVWPVGLAGGLLVERPIVDEMSGKIGSFNSMWYSSRPYPLDMAGFSVGVRMFLRHPATRFSADLKVGQVESHFLSQLVGSWDELEPRANNCSRVLVWHTRTQAPALHEEKKLTRPSTEGIEW